MLLEAEWYDPEPDPTNFYQGDVLNSIPFPTWPTYQTLNLQEKMGVLRPLQSGRVSQNPNALPAFYEARARRGYADAFTTIDRKEKVVGLCELRRVMVLTRSCALDNRTRKHLVVTPVDEIASLSEAERSEGKLVALRDRTIPHLIYLPKTPTMGESVADLLRATSIHRSFLDNVSSQLAARLSSTGTMSLQHQLSEHFGKKFGFDKDDTCPQDGLYRCSTCFHSGRPVTNREFTAGKPFGLCNECGESAAFIKLPSLGGALACAGKG